MATTLPRVNVCVSQDQFVLLKAIGKATGRPAAAVLRSCFEAVEPALQAQLTLIEAQAAITDAGDGVALAALEAAVEMLDLTADNQLDQLGAARGAVRHALLGLRLKAGKHRRDGGGGTGAPKSTAA